MPPKARGEETIKQQPSTMQHQTLALAWVMHQTSGIILITQASY